MLILTYGVEISHTTRRKLYGILWCQKILHCCMLIFLPETWNLYSITGLNKLPSGILSHILYCLKKFSSSASILIYQNKHVVWPIFSTWSCWDIYFARTTQTCSGRILLKVHFVSLPRYFYDIVEIQKKLKLTSKF